MINSSNLKVNIDDLAGTIDELLSEYGEDVGDALKTTADKVTRKAAKVVKEAAPVKTGAYKQHISTKKTLDSHGAINNVIYVKSPEYRKSHLLENGHAINGGAGRTKSQPHFKNGEDYVRSNFEKDLKTEIEKL